MAQIKRRELERELVPVREVELVWIRESMAAKSILLGIRPKLGPMLDDYLKIKQREKVLDIVEKNIHAALKELSEVRHETNTQRGSGKEHA